MKLSEPDQPVRPRRALGALAALLVVAACGSEGDVGPQSPEVIIPAAEVDPAPAVLKRLTKAQYRNVIVDTFGDAIAVPISLEPDLEQEGFLAVGASSTSISELGVERYESAAFTVADQALAPEVREGFMPCAPSGTQDDACAGQVVAEVGRRLWRRPLSDGERQRYVDVAGLAATTLGDFYEGLAFGIAGMLQSPHFLFRAELGEAGNGGLRYSNLEMASRLSFFLWNSAPDDALLEAAAAGELTNPETLPIHVDRMLESDLARRGLRNFFDERFHLHELDDLVKDGEVFTGFSADLGPDAREETLALVEHLVFDLDADYRNLFTTKVTFINRRLASLYNVPAPVLEGFGRTLIPAESPRQGLLGHASILAGNAHATATSATLRGKFVRETLLCGKIPPPPADVDTSLPEPSTQAPTLRDRIGDHLQNPACSNCHLIMDPIGLGLERFDGIGRFRLQENGENIDPSGDLTGAPFADARGLGQALATHRDVGPCMTRHMYRYANGSPETGGEEQQIERLSKQFEASGYRIRTLMREVALSDGFRLAKEAE